MEILSGQKASKLRAEKIKAQITELGFSPKLVIIRIGDRIDSKTYVNRKVAYAKLVGATTEVIHFPETVKEEEVIATIKKANLDKSTNGIIVQLPLPAHLNKKRIIESIASHKDVDGLTDANIAKLFDNDEGVIPATPRGILTLLKTHNIEVAGKQVVVIGRSRLVGKSAALYMLNQNATVTICHSKTRNLKEITKQADIVLVAAGSPKLITKDYLRAGQVVIDVGIGADEDKNIVGDVDFESVKDMDIKLSPVPGGVGPMTVASLFENLVTVSKQSHSSLVEN